MSNATKLPIVKSATRTLDIIDFIVYCPKPPTFTAIQEALDIPKSSLSYLLQNLMNRDYIQCDKDMRVYYPGIKLIKISASCINNTNISREIWVGIRQLSEDLGATTHAALLEGNFVVYIAKCQSVQDLSVVANIGFRIPAHATAVGKMLLSTLSDADLEDRFRGVELKRYTENTLVSYEKLVEEVKLAAERGYAIDNQEIIPGGICVAAPISDNTNRIIAALSATVPAVQVDEERLGSLIKKVQVAARNVSMRLGKI
jgi:DNA-binding IclR family transcriptional regulator